MSETQNGLDFMNFCLMGPTIFRKLEFLYFGISSIYSLEILKDYTEVCCVLFCRRVSSFPKMGFQSSHFQMAGKGSQDFMQLGSQGEGSLVHQ